MQDVDTWTVALVSLGLLALSLLACGYPAPLCSSQCGHESDADAAVEADDDEDYYDTGIDGWRGDTSPSSDTDDSNPDATDDDAGEGDAQ